MDWQPIETAPKDGTPFIAAHYIDSNDIHGYVPWQGIGVVIAWWADSFDKGWRICFMYDSAADSYGVSSQFFQELPETALTHWMPLPAPPSPPTQKDTAK